MGDRVLMVDDEPSILDGMRRALRGQYDITTASSGPAGLDLQKEATAAGTPFAVVVSDMRMPEMDGSKFLAAVRVADPDAVCLILSGQADLTSTVAAVNDAGLFRFLTKPCEPVDLTRALDAALRQHRLVVAEREILERTLLGAVDVLVELLGMAAPEAFGRTARIRVLATAGAAAMGCTDDWRLPLAAALSQIGCIAIPETVMRLVEAGADLTEADADIVAAHPGLARELLTRIPRLEEVATWVGDQPLAPDTPAPSDAAPAHTVFAAATSFLLGYETTGTTRHAAKRLEVAGYPEVLVQALRLAADADLTRPGVRREVTAELVRAGMVLEQDVVTTTGMMLVRKGEQVTGALALRIQNFAASVGVVEPIVVLDAG